MKKIFFLFVLLAVGMSAFAQEENIFEYQGLQYQISSDNTVKVAYNMEFNDSELIIPEKVTGSGKEYTVTGISDGAFSYNRNITDVRISATVKNIEKSAFENCSNLTSLTFEGESQLGQIGAHAFSTTGLTTIDIPATVKTIEYLAFADNTALRQVYMHSNNPSGYSSIAFEHCGDAVIYAPIESYENYKNQFSNNKVEVPMDIFKPYALNTIEEGLNALNTLSDEERKLINQYLSDITTAATFDAAYAAFTNAMPIINDQSKLEKKLKDAISILATRKNGPTIEIRANDGTTIKLYNIEKVNFGKEE